jgi:hypothetical protein
MRKVQRNFEIAELKITDTDAALNILNSPFEEDPTLFWSFLTAPTVTARAGITS